ncbi:MAG: ubiquinol-cytochrome c reductase iron-sulfur subunit [Dermatophilaceae bacterium]
MNTESRDVEGPRTTRRVFIGGGLAVAFAVSSCSKPGIQVSPSDVPVGGGKILPDAYYVVTQPTAGQYRAFTKLCPHAGCPVSEIVNSRIHCPCHGSEFSVEDGSVITGPATQGLGRAKVELSNNVLYVTA